MLAIGRDLFGPHMPAPTHLYHYTTFQGVEGILRGLEIWASSCLHLNDTQELRHACAVAQAVVRDKRSSEKDGRFAEFLDALASRIDQTAEWVPHYVVSFSRDDDALEQWRAYGGHSGGCAIGFDFEGLAAIVRGLKGPTLVPCMYNEEQQRALMARVIDMHRSAVNGDPSQGCRNSIVSFLTDLSLVSPAVKHPSFEREREWRLITRPRKEAEVNLRPTESGIVPYIKVRLAKNVGKAPIKRIVVGPSQQVEDNRKALVAWRDSRFATFQVHGSKVPFRTA